MVPLLLYQSVEVADDVLIPVIRLPHDVMATLEYQIPYVSLQQASQVVPAAHNLPSGQHCGSLPQKYEVLDNHQCPCRNALSAVLRIGRPGRIAIVAVVQRLVCLAAVLRECHRTHTRISYTLP